MYEYEIYEETKESPKSTLNWMRPVTNRRHQKKRKRNIPVGEKSDGRILNDKEHYREPS